MRCILILLKLFIFSPVLKSQDLTAGIELAAAVKPPQVVIDKFTEEFPSVTPKWSKEGENFRADFVDPNTLKGLSILYDKNGKVVRRESEMDNSSYPPGISQYFIKKYPGEKFKTWSSLDESGKHSYYIRRDKGVLWFDHDGKFLGEKQ